MSFTIQTTIKAACAALALVAIGLSATRPADAASARRDPNGAVRFYDDLGQDRGFAWCLKRNARWFGGWSDCSFFSYAQCRNAIIGPPGGDCEPNPWAAHVTEPPPRTRTRR
jgi:hypothetical protein